jgi:hypothetical protein
VAVATATEIPNVGVGGAPFPAAFVQLVVGDRDGNYTTTMLQDVRNKLLEFRAGGIPVVVVGGIVSYEAVTWDIDWPSGVDSLAGSAAVRSITVAVTQFMNPGQTLLRSTLIAAARTVPNAIVNDTSLVAPAGDIIAATSTTIPRVRPTDVTFV